MLVFIEYLLYPFCKISSVVIHLVKVPLPSTIACWVVEEKCGQKCAVLKPLLVNPAARGAASPYVQGPYGQHRQGRWPRLELWQNERAGGAQFQQKCGLGAVKFSDVYLKPEIWIFMWKFSGFSMLAFKMLELCRTNNTSAGRQFVTRALSVPCFLISVAASGPPVGGLGLPLTRSPVWSSHLSVFFQSRNHLLDLPLNNWPRGYLLLSAHFRSVITQMAILFQL